MRSTHSDDVLTSADAARFPKRSRDVAVPDLRRSSALTTGANEVCSIQRCHGSAVRLRERDRRLDDAGDLCIREIRVERQSDQAGGGPIRFGE